MLTKAGIYLDSNASAPLKPSVCEVLGSFLNEPGVLIPNPSSIHSPGRRAKRALSEARERVALSFGPKTDPEQIVFTSSGSEANQLAVRSVFEPLLNQGIHPHWILTAVEHDSNLQMITWLESQGGSVSTIPMGMDGSPQVSRVEELIRPETALISAVWVNNETGILTDVQSLSRIAQLRSIAFHVDAAQAWGKLSIDLEALGASFVAFSSHKIGGLAGTGVLWLGRGHPAHAILLGKQEKGRRGGTENLLGIIATGTAATTLDPLAWSARVEPLRDQLQQAICERIPGTWVNGEDAPRVANTLNLNFDQIEGDGLVMALDLAGYAVSSGSACSSGALEPSHVLLAMGRTPSQAMAAIRISLEDQLPWEILEGFVSALERVVIRMRNSANNRFSNSTYSANLVNSLSLGSLGSSENSGNSVRKTSSTLREGMTK